ncbi:DUF4446 family protein [Candidatus Galacturonibacter soehngenii]|uniref:DUF4446 family protein n=1 Tax=Candidatus Galacturonatibacter soehngenii TaxID=2307010 RepID=A0A7V7QI04_9FIRM|nr:DUF4446 family protein [Candidatus Galacturonibacter soehngenii]KAB1435680.1 DUF4446 family protein [Candidatus Galacturonibacter soehngenii]
MNLNVLDYNIYLEPLYLLIGFAVFDLLIFIIAIILMVKLGNLKKKYNVFMKGENGKSLEKMILEKLSEIETLKVSDSKNKDDIKKINDVLLSTFKKVGIVKYDAFNEMGGKLSFAVALLNEKNNGFIINAMHSREGCYTYIKEIINGESYIVLGDEERKALDEAVGNVGM